MFPKHLPQDTSRDKVCKKHVDSNAHVQFILHFSRVWLTLASVLVKTRQQKPEKEKEQGEEQSWKDKPLHGMYQTEEATDTEKSY